LSKPVILTGSQLPIDEIRTDGRENVLTSIEIAAAKHSDGSSRIKEVAIYFENNLFRGNRTTKISANAFKAFSSPNYPPLATAGIHINYQKRLQNEQQTLQLFTALDNRVALLKIFPGFNASVYQSLFDIFKIKGIILETFGAGNAPTDKAFDDLIERYIADGGNLSLNPSYTFSLPGEDQGSKFCGFFSPYITIRESNRNLSVPPAAFVSNNYVRKFAAGEPYSIVAGQKRGVLSGGNIVGVEYDFTDEDRGNLEPFGINPIIKRTGIGVVIFGNQTAYQTVNSAFNLLHVRDLLISVETDVQSILSNYLFDFNEDSIRLEIKTLVDNYLDGVQSSGGIYAYQTIMDTSNNTPEIIDMNMGVIDVIIEPARGIQKFINRITVTRTGGIASGGFSQFV
jgi:hypothetical protein